MTEQPTTSMADRWHQLPMPDSRTLAAQLHRLDQRRRIVEQQATLSAADLRLLWLLDDGTPRTLREIAEMLDLEQSTVNRQVNRAISDGYLRRFNEPGVAAALLTPTEQGRERYQGDIALTLRLYDEALGSLGDGAEQFLAALTTFTESYGAAVDAALTHGGGDVPGRRGSV